MEPAVVDVTIMHHNFRIELHAEHLSQGSILEHLIVRGELYEKETTELLCRILEPGDTFIDVGAHVGWFTLLASKIVGPEGRVVAVEPECENYNWLRKNISINNINGNTETHRMVVTSQSEMVTFYLNADNDGGHALWPPKNHSFNQKTAEKQQVIMAEGITLDDLCKQENIPEVKLIKIDTEGAEVKVLIGAGQLLRSQKVKHIIAEVNQFGLVQMGTNVQRMIRFVEGFGYVHSPVGYKGDEYVYNILFSLGNKQC